MAKQMYTVEQLQGQQYFFKGKVMSFDEAAAALGQGGNASVEEKVRVIIKMLDRGDSKFKVHGQKKKNHDQKVLEAVYEEVLVEDTLEAYQEVHVSKSEEQRAQQAEAKGDVVHAVKNLTITDPRHAGLLSDYLQKVGIRFDVVPLSSGDQMFVMQNISDIDINKINGKLGRIELGEKADKVFKEGVASVSVATKGAVQVTGKVAEGVMNVATSTTIQLGKSLADIGAGAFVQAKRESAKQKRALAQNPEFLEASLAMKKATASLKAKIGFGAAKERAGWS